MLLLNGMLLLDVLSLLRVTLFHLLFLRVVDASLFSLLMVPFLMLLQLLMFLTLLSGELVFLVLVSLVGGGIAGIRRRERVRLEFTGVAVVDWRRCRVVDRLVSRAILCCRARFISLVCFVDVPGRISWRSFVRAAGLSGGDCTAPEV